MVRIGAFSGSSALGFGEVVTVASLVTVVAVVSVIAVVILVSPIAVVLFVTLATDVTLVTDVAVVTGVLLVLAVGDVVCGSACEAMPPGRSQGTRHFKEAEEQVWKPTGECPPDTSAPTIHAVGQPSIVGADVSGGHSPVASGGCIVV